MKIGAQLRPGLDRARQQLFEAHGSNVHFTGCAVGLRTRGGQRTDEPVVIAMVAKKLPAGAVSRSRLLPATVNVDGRRWGVDVVEVGPLTLDADPRRAESPPREDGPITGAFRPLVQGCGVSDFNGAQPGTGTLGCMVKDTSDNKVCVLGSNVVLAQNGLVPSPGYLLQPGLLDMGGFIDHVATLKRFVKFSTGGPNSVNVAISQLMHGIAYSQDTALPHLMKPISAAHPAVGMCAFSDGLGQNCFLVPIGTTLSAIGAVLLPATPGSPCTADPQIGMHIEKVARTSGYTSSTVDAIGATIKVADSLTGRVLVFENMIWTQGFHLPGDSGAVACAGGNGRTFVPPPKSVCPVLGSVGHFFSIPLANDGTLSTKLKNQFLAQSLVGNLMIGLVYNNSKAITKRVKGKKASGTDQAYAQTYYKKYHRLVKAALADPASTKRVVTQGNLDDFQFILAGLSGAGGAAILTPAESKALQTIYNDVLVHTKGMDYQRLVAYMNKVDVYERVVKALAKVPTLSLTGTIVEDSLSSG